MSSRVSHSKINEKISLIAIILAANLLVRIAGENLASSVPESASERCEQCALGLPKLAPNRQHARQSNIELLLGDPKKRSEESRQIIASF
jgi:hypothetical protein